MVLPNHRHWWRVAAATAGLGAAIGTGQAAAWATPTETAQTPSDSTAAVSGPAKNDDVKTVDRVHRPERPGVRRAELAAQRAAERHQALREAATKVSAELRSAVRRDLAGMRSTLSDVEDAARKGPARALIGALEPDHQNRRDRRVAIPGADQTASGAVTPPQEATADTAAPGRITGAADAASFLNARAESMGAPAGFARVDNIKVQQVGTPDGFSETVYRVGHQRDGIKVLGSEVIVVTDSDGVVTSVVDNYDSRVDTMDMTLSRGMTTGSGAAAAALAAYVGSANPRPYRVIADLMIATGIVRPKLVIDALDDDVEPQLVWRVSIDPPDLPALTGIVDPGSTYYLRANGAQAGAVVREVSNAQALTIGKAASTTAKDELGQRREINIVRLGLLLFDFDTLQDTVRDIYTNRTVFLLFVGPPLPLGFPEFRGLFGWNKSAVSAQANIAVAYDYFDVLGHRSWDDKGESVIINVGYNPHDSWDAFTNGYANAFWDPSTQSISFGDRGDLEAALDVVAHEYVHAVVSHVVSNGGSVLDHGESGALNEAYADLLGLLIEDKSGTDRWLIGEDGSMKDGPLRNLADPSSIVTAYGPYRDHYGDPYTESGDDGGEHVNSTIFSHAGYLMMTDPATTGVSDDEWARLYYHSLYRLSDGAKFGDGRAAIVGTAQDMGFTDAEIDAIEQAFDDVGIESAGNVLRV
jgi:bacillolysin